MRITIPQHFAWSLWAVLLVGSYLLPGGPGARHATGEGGPAPGLACNDTINITQDGDCQLLITPDQLLEGDPGCLRPEDFEIVIYDSRPGNGPLLDGQGVFRYEIRRRPEASCTEPEFSSCWGYIRADDYSPPVVTCPPSTDRVSRLRDVQLVAGTLVGDRPLADLTVATCLNGGAPGPHPYELFRFRVTKKAVYTFELRAAQGTPAGALYQEEFNPRDPCKRLLSAAVEAGDGNGYFQGGGGVYRLQVQLLPDKDYVLFTTQRDGVRSEYLWAVYASGGGRIAGLPVSRQPVVLPLFCDNIDSILNVGASLAYLGQATALDNCSTPQSLGFADKLLPAADCADRIIERTFTFRDKAGNQGSCAQRITVRQPTLADVVLPPTQAFVECDDNIMLDASGHPHPMVTGRPFLLTAFGPIFLDTVRCGIGAAYRDDAVLERCGDTRLIHRIWTVTNWCGGEQSMTMSQYVVVGDFAGPDFDCPRTAKGEPLTFSTGPFSCFAAFEAPRPAKITDNCSSTWTLEVQVLLNGVEVYRSFPPGAASYLVTGVPTGEHAFRYIVRDECGNETVRDCPFRVVDGVAPVAICDDQLQVSVGGDGRGSTTVDDVDEGSWDNCDPTPELAIRRVVSAECAEAYRAEVDTFLTLDPATGDYVTPWRTKLDFICCDVGSKVRIELRVTDEGLLSNICWLEVLVEDKIPPRCLPPHDQSVPCDSLPVEHLTDTIRLQGYFGRAGAEDNCSAVIVELEPRLDRGNCGTGRVVRRFQAVDPSGNRSAVCEQIITLTPRHAYEIKFPKDAESQTCGLPLADTLQLLTQACDLLAVSRDTTYFEADSDECYKMYIRYRVINWCEFREGSGPLVVGRDEDGDGKPGDEPVYVLRRPAHPDSTYIDGNRTEYDGFFRRVTSVGYWEYTQIIKVYDTTPPNVEVAGWQNFFCALNACTADVDLLFEVSDNCTDRETDYELEYDENDDGGRQDLDITIYIKGRYPKQRINGEFPIGRHSFYLTIRDGCGNATVKRIPFEVVDCKPPAPVCIERLAAELMPVDENGDGIIDYAANTIWATDFIASDGFDCSGIRYSVNRKGDMPHPDSASITVTCADPEILAVEVYAWDNADNPVFIQPDGSVGGPNYSHCDARIYVQDNRFNLCGRTAGPSSIAGRLATEDKRPVADAEVRLSGESSQNFRTGHDGAFAFPGIRLGYDYSLVPVKDVDPLNGVTTFDLVQIAKHILSVQRLSSPYKLIAADANRSGSITTIDLIQLRKLILGAEQRFGNNTSWRFVPADHVFADPANPWKGGFPEVININDFDLTPVSRDFVAVKTGDVNGSAQAGAFDGVAPRTTAGVLTLRADDAPLIPGEEYRLALRADDLATVQGFQFTLEWDPGRLDLLDVEEGVLHTENLGFFPEEGLITTSWFTLQHKAQPQPALLTLRFRARAGARLSEALRLGSRRTPAEAYRQDDEPLAVHLAWTEPAEPADPGMQLYQNQPNPFRTVTVIAFTLPDAGQATLRIHDVEGRRLYERRGVYPAGRNEVTVHGADLPPGSVLFYTLETDAGIRTRKMIRLE